MEPLRGALEDARVQPGRRRGRQGQDLRVVPGLHPRPRGDHAAEAVHRAVPAARPRARDGEHLRELQDVLRERQRAVRGHEEAAQHGGAAGRPRRRGLRLEAGHGVALGAHHQPGTRALFSAVICDTVWPANGSVKK